jgi:hypothetical protein
MVRQSAPAIMSRNISLPEVEFESLAPYVMASKFPNNAIAIATEGRVMPENSWIEPKASIKLKEVEMNTAIGLFGHYKSLTLEFNSELAEEISVLAQDLLAEKPIDITKDVIIKKNSIIIPGNLIDRIGTMENDENDISVPGMVVKINKK